MMLTDIFCPHCGGQMEIDTAQRLQAMLSCPYCGRKSLMQKVDDSVQLRGIILPAAFAEADGAGEARSIGQSGPEARAMAPEARVTATETRVMAGPAYSVDGRERTRSGDGDRTEERTRKVEAEKAADPATQPQPAQPAEQYAQTRQAAPADPATPAAPARSAEPARHATAVPASAVLEHYVALAQQALAAGQMLAFNSYARQAVDCDPTDPRMHVLRARLTEEAHGFARATFLSPGWAEQTPRQRGWAMAQHFATLNAAVACSHESTHGALARQTGILIARQIRDTFLERARLRLGRKAFRGHYRPSDLRQAPLIIETCLAIDDTIVPKVSSRLVLAIREELARLDPTLARLLQRKGF